jgi:hypothetical protein
MPFLFLKKKYSSRRQKRGGSPKANNTTFPIPLSSKKF